MIRACWFITGTSKGLGKALAMAVLERPDTTVHGFARAEGWSHDRYTHHQLDLSDPESLQHIDFAVPDTVTEIVLVNNAGMLGDIAHTGTLHDEVIQKVYQLNIITPHILCNKFIAAHRAHAVKKVIINISSGAAKTPYDGWSMYCASKAALDMMTMTLAREQKLVDPALACKVYAIAPGVLNTDMQQQIRNAGEHAFSQKGKFVGLWENDQLYHVQHVAKKYLEFVAHCTGNEETIQRIVL